MEHFKINIGRYKTAMYSMLFMLITGADVIDAVTRKSMVADLAALQNEVATLQKAGKKAGNLANSELFNLYRSFLAAYEGGAKGARKTRAEQDSVREALGRIGYTPQTLNDEVISLSYKVGMGKAATAKDIEIEALQKKIKELEDKEKAGGGKKKGKKPTKKRVEEEKTGLEVPQKGLEGSEKEEEKATATKDTLINEINATYDFAVNSDPTTEESDAELGVLRHSNTKILGRILNADAEDKMLATKIESRIAGVFEARKDFRERAAIELVIPSDVDKSFAKAYALNEKLRTYLNTLTDVQHLLKQVKPKAPVPPQLNTALASPILSDNDKKWIRAKVAEITGAKPQTGKSTQVPGGAQVGFYEEESKTTTPPLPPKSTEPEGKKKVEEEKKEERKGGLKFPLSVVGLQQAQAAMANNFDVESVDDAIAMYKAALAAGIDKDAVKQLKESILEMPSLVPDSAVKIKAANLTKD